MPPYIQYISVLPISYNEYASILLTYHPLLQYCDYHKSVEGLGGRGMLLGRGDNIKDKLQEAQRLYREEGTSVLVNALIGKTKFREGSISV